MKINNRLLFMRISLPPILSALLATALQAGASEPDATPAPRELLSRAELRACMDRESGLDERREALKQEQDAHTAAGALLSQEATELSELLRTLDNTDKAAVEDYNKRNEARNRLVEINNKRAEKLNATSAELRAAEADYMAECTARPFLKTDEEAILKERAGGKRQKRKKNKIKEETI
jgi:anion-transporting  ArsA/GET3 family ATPase